MASPLEEIRTELLSVSGNSYVESPGGQVEDDKLLKVDHYKRSRQQQIDVGLLPAEETEVSSEL